MLVVDLVNGTSYSIDDRVEIIDLTRRRSTRVCNPVCRLTYIANFQQVVRCGYVKK